MTSDIGVERAEQQFLFHCSCGAAVETSQKCETCGECGARIEVVWHVPTPHGEKYKLRINKHTRSAEPLLWPLVCPPARMHATWQSHEGPDHDLRFRTKAPTQATWHYLEPPDYNKRFLRSGLLILLAPFCLPLLLALCLSVPRSMGEHGRPQEPIIETPEPTDCGLFSGCHYERRDVHVNGKRGGYTVVEWERVED